MFMKYVLFLIIIAISYTGMSQPVIKYDDIRSAGWNDEVKEVSISSSIDEHEQRAYFYTSTSKQKQPLIISLHTWSGDYTQNDPLVKQCLLNNWNYIHPDFRGPNWTVQACGSPLVLSDIDDAIQFAISNGNVNMDEIHVVGVSGGGYATLMTFLNTKHHISSFSAWVPISDLESWYYESKGRGNGYADHILKSTSSDTDIINVEEARKRSPMYMKIPSGLESRGNLYIYTGIHDGYSGSVPITQSILFYNRLVHALGGSDRDAVPDGDIIKMVTSRMFTSRAYDGYIADRKIQYKRDYKNIQLIVFEGSHEMLPPVAFDHINCCGIEKRNRILLTIGDSNGAATDGWVNQLRSIRTQDVIFNESLSGNTLGFDNLGFESLNTLKNLNRYLAETSDKTGKPIDVILINLGTNDCKAIFADRQDEVTKNLEKLIRGIRAFKFSNQKSPPEIRIISPPPYGPDDILKQKYHGADSRVRKLIPAFEHIAKENKCPFLNIYEMLKEDFARFSPDGVHMETEGQKIIAKAIDEWMR